MTNTAQPHAQQHIPTPTPQHIPTPTSHQVPSQSADPKPLRRRSGRAVGVTAAIALLLGACLALPAGIWIGAKNVESPIATTPQISPDIVPVSAGSRRNSVNVSVEKHTTSGLDVTSTDAGRVTWAPPLGAELTDGKTVTILDNRIVLGYTAKTPLWRDLSRSAKGDDVKQLQEMLVRWGHLKGTPDGVYGPSTVTAVTALNKALNRESLKGGFSLASLAWLGPEPLIVDELVAPVGSAYAGGTSLAKGPTQIAWMSVMGGDSAAIESGATQLSVPVLAEPIELESRVVTDAESLALLAPLFGPEGPLQANLEDLEETPTKSVPASALVTGATGATCVYDGTTNEPHVVTSIGGGNSTITFAQDFPLQQVIANPGQLEGLAPCGE